MSNSGSPFIPPAGNDPAGGRRRREPRQVVPVISFTIQVELDLSHSIVRAKLWDISPSGACLLLPPNPNLATGDRGPLKLIHPYGNGDISTQGRVQWLDPLRNACYAGVVFLDSVDFSTTFLAMLLSRSNRHHQPGYGPKPLSWNDPR
jgi:hypothetical protein